jgi:hypothetical protein
MGEPATSCVFPALTNGIFAATGRRLSRLPVDPRELTAESLADAEPGMGDAAVGGRSS